MRKPNVQRRQRTRGGPNSDKIILSLCDYSGAWPQPYIDAGYTVIQVDLEFGDDVRLFPFPGQVHGVLAAPPCTHFSASGACHWKKKGDKPLLEGLSIFDACARIVLFTQPKFWVFENPVGRLKDYIGPATYTFHPYMYGDAYTKRTCLWGNFNIPSPTHYTRPDKMRKGSHSLDVWLRAKGIQVTRKNRARLRSTTPSGFAQAFFEVNK